MSLYHLSSTHLDHTVHRLSVEEADFDGVGGNLSCVAEESLLQDEPVLAAAHVAPLQGGAGAAGGILAVSGAALTQGGGGRRRRRL